MCLVDQCDSKVLAKGLCRKHYLRQYKHGSVYHVERHRDGRKSHPLWKTWHEMKARCQNDKHKFYHRYGGRGIKVCDRWLADFWSFVNDMGDKPDGMTLDRIDNDGNYEPENCRWADDLTQGKNRDQFKRTPELIAKVLSFPRKAKNGRGSGMTQQEIADEIGGISAWLVGEIVRTYEKQKGLTK